MPPILPIYIIIDLYRRTLEIMMASKMTKEDTHQFCDTYMSEILNVGYSTAV